jgi:hypothetical protein
MIAMKTRSLRLGLLAGLAMLVSAAALAAPSSAAPDTVYCLNGVSTTLPATVTASSVNHGSTSAAFDEPGATYWIAQTGGTFYFGWLTTAPGWLYRPTPTSMEAGYTTNTVALGACVATAAPGITHVGVCKLLPRADGTTGLFQQITVAEWNDPDGRYFDAPAASWVEGLGLTCDNPLALGYKATGIKVAWGGRPDPGNQPNGVRASGLNDIYSLFVR